MDIHEIPRILVVDFDNTLAHQVNYPDDSTIRLGNKLVHAYVRRKKRRGWDIIIKTAPTGKGLGNPIRVLQEDDIPFDPSLFHT